MEQKIDLLRDMIKDLCESNKEDHQEIIQHQKETNGRVNRLEIWRAGLIGGMAVVTSILIPVLVFILKLDL